MPALYWLGVQLYILGIRMLSAMRHPKAREAYGGRKHWRLSLPGWHRSERVCWVHCASLGEFEQGRPLIEALRAEDPGIRIALTFFSPSGYLVRKAYPQADWVGYLPFDTPGAAAEFVNTLRPVLAIFVKYDLWWGYLRALGQRKCPAVLVSAQYRSIRGFRGKLRRTLWDYLDLVCVQNLDSAAAVRREIPGLPVAVTGDTRYDRVRALRQQSAHLPWMEPWQVSTYPVLVAGSTWPPDARCLAEALRRISEFWNLILVPHEVGESALQEQERFFPGSVRLSRYLSTQLPECPTVLIVDCIGLLGSLYRYGTACYIGGGFGKGIHNTLEAAVWEKPLAFGPRFEQFDEAVALLRAGAATPIQRADALASWLTGMRVDAKKYAQACQAAGTTVATGEGATVRTLTVLKAANLWPLPERA